MAAERARHRRNYLKSKSVGCRERQVSFPYVSLCCVFYLLSGLARSRSIYTLCDFRLLLLYTLLCTCVCIVESAGLGSLESSSHSLYMLISDTGRTTHR